MKWILLTCPERLTESLDTLRSLGESDFPGRPYLNVDGGAGPPGRQRQIAARLAALEGLLRDFPGERLFALLDDDLVVNQHVWAHVSRWRPTRRHMLFGSLYRIGLAGPIPPDHARDERAGGFVGAQALLLSRPVVEALLLNWHAVGGELGWDRHLAAVLELVGLPVTFHVPSLVQHRHPPSLVGSEPHRSACFSLEWSDP